MKDTFIIRTEWFESISELDDTEQAMVLRNLFYFHNGEENLINLNNRAVKLVWKLLEPNLKRNIDSYDKRCDTSANNGKLGGRPKKQVEENLNNLKKPNEKPNENQEPNESLNDSDSDSVLDSEFVIDTDLKEISKEILERDLENEKLRLEVERLNQALEEKKKKDSTKGGGGKPKKVLWLDLKDMELPEIYNEEEFRETWQSWCDFKQERKETVLTDKGFELWFKKLETLSSRDIATSIQIVNESIANNWQGIFELKNQKSNAKPNSQKSTTPYGAVGGVNAQGRGMFFAPIYDTAESSTSDVRHEVEGFYESEL